jgi:NADPH:quinone reductase-like Zn-dependent oxidoreductase
MPIPTDLNKRHRETLDRVFNPPKRRAPRISFQEIVGALRALGADVDDKREGSRVKVRMPNGSSVVFHRPHKGRDLDGGTTAHIRRWLIENGVQP